jgi:hypothetical protein
MAFFSEAMTVRSAKGARTSGFVLDLTVLRFFGADFSSSSVAESSSSTFALASAAALRFFAAVCLSASLDSGSDLGADSATSRFVTR